MSDRKLVTIDSGQFEALKTRLDALSTALSPLVCGLDIYQALNHIERTLFDGFKLVAQGSGGSGDNSQVLTAINILTGKVDKFMATQEERLQGISTKIDEVLSDLAALRANNPQIEDEISAIEAKLSIAQPATDTTGGVTVDEG